MELAINTNEYEISYLLESAIPEAEIESEGLRIQTLLSQNGGMISQNFVPQKKRLFYPIKKQSQAYLGTVYFSANPEVLPKLKRALQLDQKVLRFIILNRAETMKQEAAAMLTRKPMTEKPAEAAEKPAQDKEVQPQSFEEKLKKILKG